jgi:hypothetical protein
MKQPGWSDVDHDSDNSYRIAVNIRGGRKLVFMTGFPIAQWSRHALALILLSSFVSMASPTAFADAEHDPIAAIVAKVSPAVVRVVTVRLLPPAESDATTAKSLPASPARALRSSRSAPAG